MLIVRLETTKYQPKSGKVTQAGSSWAYSRSFYYDSPNVFRNSDGSGFSYGFSVRCVRDIER